MRKGGEAVKTRNIIGAVSLIVLMTTAVFLLPAIYTTKDSASTGAPPSGQIADKQTPIDDQGDGLCGAYAGAYVLRYYGIEADGSILGTELHRVFGFTSPSSVARLLRDHGLDAKAYHGDLAALKKSVSQGKPVIVFLRNSNDTHYAVVTGYDDNNLYLADSLKENANADETLYNRIIAKDEFEQLWKTGSLLDDNIYIAVNEKR